MLTARGPRVLETHLRLAGDEIPLLVRDVTGVDLERLTLEQVGDYAGPPRPLSPPERGAGASAVWFLGCGVGGRVSGLGGLSRARRVEGVTRVEVDVCPGDRVHPLVASQDRVGLVRARAADPAAAIERARTAAAMLEISVAAELGAARGEIV